MAKKEMSDAKAAFGKGDYKYVASTQTSSYCIVPYHIVTPPPPCLLGVTMQASGEGGGGRG
jgi:hypothetical protein